MLLDLSIHLAVAQRDLVRRASAVRIALDAGSCSSTTFLGLEWLGLFDECLSALKPGSMGLSDLGPGFWAPGLVDGNREQCA
jgi:hypothetical protein